MGDRPLPLRAWQVRACLDDRLSVLVVPAKVKRGTTLAHVQWRQNPNGLGSIGEVPFDMMESPLSVGDRLWARETFFCDHSDFPGGDLGQMLRALEFRASHSCAAWEAGCPCNNGEGRSSWRSSTQLPRWASRLTLDVTEVRVCRLHDVTEDEARAAGHPISHDGRHYDPPPPEVDGWQGYGRASFFLDWSVRHGPGPYESNPWVCVARLTVHHRNIDSLAPRGNQCVASNLEGVQP